MAIGPVKNKAVDAIKQTSTSTHLWTVLWQGTQVAGALVLRVRCAASTFCGMTSNQLDACSMPRHHLVYTPRIPSSATAEEDLARFMLEIELQLNLQMNPEHGIFSAEKYASNRSAA